MGDDRAAGLLPVIQGSLVVNKAIHFSDIAYLLALLMRLEFAKYKKKDRRPHSKNL